MAQNLSKTTTDHGTIRSWAEERGGWPAEVESTAREGEAGILRIDFPGYSGEGKLHRIDWDEWFEKFDASGLAFVYEDETSGGQRSSFNKLVSRATAAARSRGGRSSRSSRSARRTGGRSAARKASRSAGKKRTGARTTRRSTGRRQASRTTVARSTSRRGAGRKGGTTRTGGSSRKGASSRKRASRSGGARRSR